MSLALVDSLSPPGTLPERKSWCSRTLSMYYGMGIVREALRLFAGGGYDDFDTALIETTKAEMQRLAHRASEYLAVMIGLNSHEDVERQTVEAAFRQVYMSRSRTDRAIFASVRGKEDEAGERDQLSAETFARIFRIETTSVYESKSETSRKLRAAVRSARGRYR